MKGESYGRLTKLLIPPPPRILTFVQIAIVSSFLFGVCANAQDTVFRYSSYGSPDQTLTASGTDVSAVQTSTELGYPTDNDVMTVSGNATHETTVSDASGDYNVSSFSVISANAGEKKTITAGNAPLYNLSGSSYTFKDLNYQGASSASTNYGAFMVVNNESVNITLDNVSFSDFVSINCGGAFAFSSESSETTITALNEVSFTNNGITSTDGRYGRGGAIFCEGDTTLNINADTLKFINNSATIFGGAIQAGRISIDETCSINITGSNILFDNNTVFLCDGGAIHTNGALVITGKDDNSKTTFSNNSAANLGGAMSIQTSASFSTGSFYFDNNKLTNYYTGTTHSGGVIDTPELSIVNAKKVSFTNNQSTYTGGAINICTTFYSGVEISASEIKADIIVFDSNTSQGFGGAINTYYDMNIEGNSISFTNNESFTRGSSSGDGGAIRSIGNLTIKGVGNNSSIVFKDNSASRYGGVIAGYDLFVQSNNFISFIDNKSAYGGVFYGHCATFEGDDAEVSFIGNAATSQGNDIYLINPSSGHSILTFKDKGSYSFDGGIILNSSDAETLIDEASVLLAGRENVTNNNYQLQNVTLSNGGKLTVNLDYINSLNGTFTFTDSDSFVEHTDASQNQTAKIKSSEGDGIFSLVYSAAGGVKSESLVISSGRVDIKGAMTAGLDVEANAVFSPGNSVGELDLNGNFTLASNGKLLMEVNGAGADVLTCNEFTDNGGLIELVWQNNELPGFSTCDIIISTSDLTDVYNKLIGNLNFTASPTIKGYYDNGFITVTLVGDDSNIVRLSIDRNAVPEPSTWALLVLGAAGLAYMRKRSRQ